MIKSDNIEAYAVEIYDKFHDALDGYSVGDHYQIIECSLAHVDMMLDIRMGLYINEGSVMHQMLLDLRKEIELLR